jgi:RNA polymerase sigma factor (sigma-70 family)
VIDEPARRLDESALRALVPRVLASLVQRGEDFDAAEDALQEALLAALRVWPEHPPRDQRAWLATVATRRLVDARRSEAARHRREEAMGAEPRPGPTEEGDDTLFLLFCCCHPGLAPASQVALTLRAVGGLTTREIADAFYVPEATMAQRISRAKRALAGPPAAWISPATWPSCCECSTSSTRPGILARPPGSTWRARRSDSPASSPLPPKNRRRAGCSR